MKNVIVVPTYNEAANIEELLRRLRAAAANATIIVVDDSSPDGTSTLARSFAPAETVRVIVRDGERGLGGALVAGLSAALADGAEAVVTMDADLSHAPEDVPRLLAASAGAHLVLGSRRVPGGSVAGWSKRRNLLSRAAAGISRLVFGLKTHDATTGFRVYRADFLKAIDLTAIKSKGYAFQEEMVMTAENGGFAVAEVPIEFVDRKAGSSKLSLVEAALSLGSLIKLRFRSRRNRPAVLFAVMAYLALILRYCLAPLPGSEYDLGAFSYWAATGQNLNFFHFYYPGAWMKLSFPNYALYFPMLAALGPAADATSEIGRMLLKTPAIFGDIFLAGIIYFYAKPRFRLAAAAFILLNPAVWFNSAVFGQVDCFHAAFMLLAVVALTRKNFRLAWIWFIVATFFKIQAIAILPILAAVHFKNSGIKKTLVELVPAGVLAALFALPFVLASSFGGIWRSMQSSVGMFPSVSINAWNPWYLLHMISGRWVNDAETVFGVSYRNIGLVVFALAAAVIISALPKRPSRMIVTSAACVMVFAFFMLPTEMHERYLYPFIPLVALVIGESWVVAMVAIAVSIVVFMDMNFAQPWLSAIDAMVRTVNQCVAWSMLSIALFVIFFVWYMRRAAAERRCAEDGAKPSSTAR